MPAGFRYKQTIVIRTDIQMSVGKLAAQACHASLEAALKAMKSHPDIFEAWLREGAKKVVLRVESLEELLRLREKAERLGIPNALITDRGLTELPPGTVTALAVGPAESSLVDRVTGRLRLL